MHTQTDTHIYINMHVDRESERTHKNQQHLQEENN